jgi:hypothetical protein
MINSVIKFFSAKVHNTLINFYYIYKKIAQPELKSAYICFLIKRILFILK